MSVGDPTYVALRDGGRLLEFTGDGPMGVALAGGFSAPVPAPGDVARLIQFPVELLGDDPDEPWRLYREVHEFFAIARQRVSDGRRRSGVELLIRSEGASTIVAFDVLAGDMLLPDTTMASLSLTDTWIQNTVVRVVCLPYGRGNPVAGSAGVTLTSGAASYVDIPHVLGDVPAPTRLTITDVSTSSEVINRLTVGLFTSRSAVDPADVAMVADAVTVSPGVDASEADTIGGERSRLALAATFQTVAQIDRPADAMNGRYHTFLRVRDSSNLLTPPENLTAVPRNSVYRRQRSAGSTGTGTSASDVWDMPTLPGSLLVQYVTSDFVSIGTPSGWSVGAGSGASGGSPNASIFYKANASAESGAAAASTLSGSSAWEVVLEEWIGITTTSPLDATDSDRSSAGATTLAIGPTGTPTQAEELVLAVFRGGANPPTSIDGTDIVDNEAFGALSMTAYGRMAAAAAQSATASYSPATDRAGVIVTFKAVDVAREPFTPGLYTFRVSANGAGSVHSAASEPVTIRLTTGQVAELDWDAGRGTVATYSAYYTSPTEGWVVAYDTPTITTTTAIVGENNGSIGTSIPPGASTAIPADVRVGLSLANSATIWWQDGVPTQLANGEWEWLYLGVLHLPPAPTADGAAPLPWRITVQGRHSVSGTLDVDAAMFLSARADMVQVEVPGYGLATKRVWVLDSTTGGEVGARLLTTDTGADAGQVRVVQASPLRFEPGFDRVQLMGDVAGGASDVTDSKVTFAWEYVPLYLYLTGQP